jgi:hypothetical protein
MKKYRTIPSPAGIGWVTLQALDKKGDWKSQGSFRTEEEALKTVTEEIEYLSLRATGTLTNSESQTITVKLIIDPAYGQQIIAETACNETGGSDCLYELQAELEEIAKDFRPEDVEQSFRFPRNNRWLAETVRKHLKDIL